MAIVIKKKGDLYNLTSSISDECYHKEKWISENDAKAVLIELEIHRFMSNVADIQLNFPVGYMVEGKYVSGEKQYPNTDRSCIIGREAIKTYDLEEYFI